MNDILTMLNHLIGVWIGQNENESDHAPQKFVVKQLQLEDDGFWLTGVVSSKLASGELTVRGRIESSGGSRHKLHLRLEQCPEKMSETLEAFRNVIESARIGIELDFETDTHET